jgi:glycyl-tRNA synthetase beta chain
MTQDNNPSFLLEIGTEDLPARFISPALQQIKDNTVRILRENSIACSGIKVFGTPRRLALIAEGIPRMQADRTKEVYGPSKKAAFDASGNPTRAAAGFAQSQGVSVESLVIRKKDKGEYVVAVIEEKGMHVGEVLPEILKKIVLSIHLPKAMQWGDSTLRFVRPIRWLLALFDTDTISFDIDGIRSSNLTRGHRFLSPAAFQIKEIPSYRKLLSNNYVIVDIEERKKVITEKMRDLLSERGERPIEDDELLDTVVNLVEYPVPVIATFSDDYLKLPKELLITVMKGHQKYFAVENADGAITNSFVVISNTTEDNADTVRVGAERVIRARFEDARFYFEEDGKKPLSDRIADLKKVTFQENLGSLYKKIERMEAIAGFLADKLIPSAKDKLIRAAWLAKTDLISGVVREFPELQGIMGKYYAAHDGEDREVAGAIEEHYLPSYSGGVLPKTDIGALLSMADKMDNIAAFFSIGLIPTGSEDPFALRRQALGIIAILFDKGYDITLEDFLDKALENFPDAGNLSEVREKILQFYGARLETILADKGYSSDLIQSILPMATHMQLNEMLERLAAIEAFKKTQAYNDFLAAIKRINNIIPKTAVSELETKLLLEESEKQLWEKLFSVRSGLTGFLEGRKYHDAISLLASLTGPVNTFFEKVLVMDKREEIKLNRLSLLNEVWITVSAISDFSKLSANQ